MLKPIIKIIIKSCFEVLKYFLKQKTIIIRLIDVTIGCSVKHHKQEKKSIKI